MAETEKRNDPFLGFRFEIAMDDLSVAGFSECTGLKLETPMMSYSEGGVNTHQHHLPSASRQSNLVLKRGIADRKLWDWYWRLFSGKVEPKNGSIKVYDPSGSKIVMHWEFVHALPTTWDGPALNASQSAVAVESMTLVHHGLSRVT